ncbi:hypothetical protein ACRAWF_20530 [Streptomyces sp. L7]
MSELEFLGFQRLTELCDVLWCSSVAQLALASAPVWAAPLLLGGPAARPLPSPATAAPSATAATRSRTRRPPCGLSGGRRVQDLVAAVAERGGGRSGGRARRGTGEEQRGGQTGAEGQGQQATDRTEDIAQPP